MKSERAKLVALISDVESRIKEAKEIHLFRTRKEKNAEINALMAEFDNYFSRLSEVDAELVGLGEKSIMDDDEECVIEEPVAEAIEEPALEAVEAVF